MEEQNQYNNEKELFIKKQLPEDIPQEKNSETIIKKTDDDFSIFIDLMLSFLLILSVFTFWHRLYAGIALFIITTLFTFISYFRRANKPYSKDIIKKFPITAICVIMWLLCIQVSFKLFFNLSDQKHSFVFLPFIATFIFIQLPAILKEQKTNIILKIMQSVYVIIFLILEFLARLITVV